MASVTPGLGLGALLQIAFENGLALSEMKFQAY